MYRIEQNIVTSVILSRTNLWEIMSICIQENSVTIVSTLNSNQTTFWDYHKELSGTQKTEEAILQLPYKRI